MKNMIATIEFDSEYQNSPILEKQNRKEELRANFISVSWEQNHVVFTLEHYYCPSRTVSKVIDIEIIAYRASDVVHVHIHEYED